MLGFPEERSDFRELQAPTGTVNCGGWVTHMCSAALGYHWFRQWLVDCSAASHYRKQFWIIVSLGTIFGSTVLGLMLLLLLSTVFDRNTWQCLKVFGCHSYCCTWMLICFSQLVTRLLSESLIVCVVLVGSNWILSINCGLLRLLYNIS